VPPAAERLDRQDTATGSRSKVHEVVATALRFPLFLSFLALTAGSCGEQASTSPDPPDIRAAKPGTADPVVSAVDPTEAALGQQISLEVSGKNFDDGSTVALELVDDGARSFRPFLRARQLSSTPGS